jgi:polyisoprenoid-binding protein YceI
MDQQHIGSTYIMTAMKHFLLPFLIQLTGIIAFAQEYKPMDEGSSVTFTIKNLGFDSKGFIKGLQGKIVFDPQSLSTASFDVSVDAATINTDNSMRDGHLKGESYFDAKNYPRIHFISTGVRASDKAGSYIISGKLTIKDKSQDISFPFIATTAGNDYIFSGSFKINRKDFGIGGSSTISNSLTVSLTVLARK